MSNSHKARTILGGIVILVTIFLIAITTSVLLKLLFAALLLAFTVEFVVQGSIWRTGTRRRL